MNDERHDILHTRAEIASFGGADTNRCSWSLDSTWRNPAQDVDLVLDPDLT